MAKQKTGELWHENKAKCGLLKAALSKQKTRYDIDHMYFDGKAMFATDGKVMVRVTYNIEYPKGFYCPFNDEPRMLADMPKDSKFPNCDEIIPTSEIEAEAIVTKGQELMEFLIKNEVKLNVMDHDSLFTKMFATGYFWAAEYRGAGRVVVFRSDEAIVCLMPYEGDTSKHNGTEAQ